MIVIFPVLDRISLLPYFLRYYSSIGATRFVCALFNGEKNPLYEKILPLNSKYPIEIETSVICDFDQHRGALEVPGLNRIREKYATDFRWYCIADLDEFHFFHGRTLSEVAHEAEQRGYDAVHGTFLDRVAADGSFPEISGVLDETFPLGCKLSRRAGLSCKKIVLARNHVAITAGHHTAQATLWLDVAEVHHFKWSKGVLEVVRDKNRRYTQQKLPWAMQQLPRLQGLIEKQIDLNDPLLCVSKAPKIGV